VADDFFRVFRDGGIRTGICIRPTQVYRDEAKKQWNHGTGSHGPERNPLGEDFAAVWPKGLPWWRFFPVAERMIRKIEYAKKRWGCTIFYVDSVSEWFSNWSFEKTVAKHPDILLLPEWARTRSYRHSSAFSHTQFTHFLRGVPAEMQACWPDAFCCMSHYDFGKNYDEALQGVRNGNVTLFNCWYMSDEAKAIKKIYQQTGTRHTPRAEDQRGNAAQDKPTPVTLHATDEDKDAVTYSLLAPPEHGVVEGWDAKAGTLKYVPARGYAGPDSFTFKATDATGLNSNRATVSISVK